MVDLKLKSAFLQACPLKRRGVFNDWAVDCGRKGMSKQTFADIAAGRPADAQSVAKIIMFLLDDEFKGNNEASMLRAYLRRSNIPESEWTPDQLMARFTVAVDPQDPFPEGLDSITNLPKCEEPLKHVRPCESVEEIEWVVRWVFILGGKRALGSPTRLTSEEAIRAGEEFVRTSRADYTKRLVRWWRQCPWSVAVGGDTADDPRAMSVAAPVSAERYEALRTGAADMFRLDIEKGLRCSPYLFMETLAPNPEKPKGSFINGSLVHLFRTTLSQQAVLSDVTRARVDQPLRILSLGCFPEFTRMLKYFGYKPLPSTTPVANLPLWERRLWGNNHSLLDSAPLGVWTSIQHRLRGSGWADTESASDIPRPI